MAAVACASLVFLSWVTLDRAVLLGRMQSPMAEEYLHSDGLDSDGLAEAVVRAAMNNSHASVLLDRNKRDFVALMLAKVTRELEDPPNDAKNEAENNEEPEDPNDAKNEAPNNEEPEDPNAKEAATNEAVQPSFDAILSCFFGPGLGTSNLALDSINSISAMKKCVDDHACLARQIILLVGKIVGWGATIANIEQTCGAPLFTKLQDCTSDGSYGLGTPASKSLPTLYFSVLGTGLVTTSALWGTILQCESKGGGKKLVPGTEWGYLITTVVKAMKSGIDVYSAKRVIQSAANSPTALDDIAGPEPVICAKTSGALRDLSSAVTSTLRFLGQWNADAANEKAGGLYWCAGAVTATAAQIPALAASYCQYLACKSKSMTAKVTEESYDWPPLR